MGSSANVKFVRQEALVERQRQGDPRSRLANVRFLARSQGLLVAQGCRGWEEVFAVLLAGRAAACLRSSTSAAVAVADKAGRGVRVRAKIKHLARPAIKAILAGVPQQA